MNLRHSLYMKKRNTLKKKLHGRFFHVEVFLLVAVAAAAAARVRVMS
jgi:hypothetical protein